MKIIVDQEKCIGCGTCEAMCPDVFKLNPQTYKAEVLKEGRSTTCNIEEVVKACAVEAIEMKK